MPVDPTARILDMISAPLDWASAAAAPWQQPVLLAKLPLAPA